jgi:hypothetical protein
LPTNADVAGPLFAGVLLGADGGFSTALLFAGALLAASGAALARRAPATPAGGLTN